MSKELDNAFGGLMGEKIIFSKNKNNTEKNSEKYYNLQRKACEKYGVNTVLCMQSGKFYEIYERVTPTEDEINYSAYYHGVLGMMSDEFYFKKGVVHSGQDYMWGFPLSSKDKYITRI